MGTFRFWAIGVYKRKEVPPPIFGGRLFETISGDFPNPAIPPYIIRTLHFVERRLCRSQQSVGCDSGSGQIIMETLLRRHIFFVGPPLARWVVGGGPTNRWPNEQWSDNKMFFDVIWCHDFLVLAPEVIKTSPMRLDLAVFSPWIQKSTTR